MGSQKPQFGESYMNSPVGRSFVGHQNSDPFCFGLSMHVEYFTPSQKNGRRHSDPIPAAKRYVSWLAKHGTPALFVKDLEFDAQRIES